MRRKELKELNELGHILSLGIEDALEDHKQAETYEGKICEIQRHCRDLLLSKRREYAAEDPFHCFRRAAELQGITPAQALVGMMDKHVVSVHDMVNEAAEGAKFPAEKWQEKIGDNINYLFILWAMTQLLEEPNE